MQDDERARRYLNKMSLVELQDWMEKHDCLPTHLLAWDDEQWATKEDYEEAMRQDHVERLSKQIRFATPVK